VAVVDGNVERVVTRLFRLERRCPRSSVQVSEKVRAMVPEDRPGDFAQAMMDLGATICTPKNPACALCPWKEAARPAPWATMLSYPVKAPKKAKPHRQGARWWWCEVRWCGLVRAAASDRICCPA
jgi:A/G-specific adenine glycosylase